MTAHFIIVGPSGHEVKVNDGGALAVGPTSFSEPFAANVSTTAVTNVVPARPGSFFVITDMLIAQDRTNTDTQVDIFEADSVDGALTKAILTIDLIKSQVVPLTGLNLISTGRGKWINFQSDSASSTITVTLLGYYRE